MEEGTLTSQTLQRFTELEELAEEIMEDKHQIIELDRKRNTNREAMRALQKGDAKFEGLAEEGALNKMQLPRCFPTGSKASKSWVCIGNIFMKLPDSNIQEMLHQDQKNLDDEISKLRKDLKPKVSKLHELEGLPEVKGFNLTALTQDDLQNLQA